MSGSGGFSKQMEKDFRAERPKGEPLENRRNTGVPILVSLNTHQVVSKSTIGQFCADLRAHCIIMSLHRDKRIEQQTGSSSGKHQTILNYHAPLEPWPSMS
ncbi:hypothetical protein N7519_011154 [Penicillium mononematosum]|uniref:uncharacterized protein n=1 Tax=Penicillium mononematosum TaxID=268346 RepID=UPI002548D476|nr:uncharacterized protein N7519_011154 [Penicillium mononematosum]KAJ6180693.1 hypothetical protein N7519_011154 [Penicillium mononematosum]